MNNDGRDDVVVSAYRFVGEGFVGEKYCAGTDDDCSSDAECNGAECIARGHSKLINGGYRGGLYFGDVDVASREVEEARGYMSNDVGGEFGFCFTEASSGKPGGYRHREFDWASKVGERDSDTHDENADEDKMTNPFLYPERDYPEVVNKCDQSTRGTVELTLYSQNSDGSFSAPLRITHKDPTGNPNDGYAKCVKALREVKLGCYWYCDPSFKDEEWYRDGVKKPGTTGDDADDWIDIQVIPSCGDAVYPDGSDLNIGCEELRRATRVVSRILGG